MLRGLLALGLLCACAPAEPFQARFAVRGRWPGEPRIGYRLEAEGGPLSGPAFARAVEEALAAWNDTGAARFVALGPEGPADLVFAWRRGAHDACPPFGVDPSVAHAGPVASGTFVHFDAGRAWSEAALAQAALHEAGHVLGLEHSPDESAVMYHEPSSRRARLARADHAGIHSLYGGGSAAPGDLVIGAGSGGLVLHQVAPRALVEWTVFDTDGDGDAELVTWRTDAAGHGALWSYHFAAGPVLARTLGPCYGVSAPGLALEFRAGADGTRWLVQRAPGGAEQARAFDEHGFPQDESVTAPACAGRGAQPGPTSADLDGDGKLERIERRE